MLALTMKDSGSSARMADGGTYVPVLVLLSCGCATGTRVATVERNGQREGIARKAEASSLEATMPDIPEMQ